MRQAQPHISERPSEKTWIMSNKAAIFALAAGLLVATGARAAAPCTLTKLASYDITVAPNGALAIPVEVNGSVLTMMLDPEKPVSAIKADVALSIHAPFVSIAGSSLTKRFIMYDGLFVTRTATLSSVQFGPASLENMKVDVLDYGYFLNGVDGVLGMDMLHNFDVEWNLGNRKLGIFSPDHCEGQGLYWARAAAVIPFAFDADNKVRFPMELDGKPVNVGISMRRGYASMRFWAVQSVFGFDENTPGLTRVATDNNGLQQFRYPFHTLSASDFSIANPAIDIFSQRGEPRCDGNAHAFIGSAVMSCLEPDFNLTPDILSRLRLYFAAKEKKLYITGFNATLDATPTKANSK